MTVQERINGGNLTVAERIANGEQFAILTDGAPKFDVNPGYRTLEDLLTRLGCQFVPVEGFYEGKSDGISYVVFGVAEETAIRWGFLYGQESVATPAGLVYCGHVVDGVRQEGVFARWTGRVLTGEEARSSGFFSVENGGEAFSLELDWS